MQSVWFHPEKTHLWYVKTIFFLCSWKAVVLINLLPQVFGSLIFLPAGAIIHDNSSKANYPCCTFLPRGKKKQDKHLRDIYVFFLPIQMRVSDSRAKIHIDCLVHPLTTISSRNDSQNPQNYVGTSSGSVPLSFFSHSNLWGLFWHLNKICSYMSDCFSPAGSIALLTRAGMDRKKKVFCLFLLLRLVAQFIIKQLRSQRI